MWRSGPCPHRSTHRSGRTLPLFRCSARPLNTSTSRRNFLSPLAALGRPLDPAVHHLQIRHDELQVDGLDVPLGVHGHVGAGVRHHVHDVLVVKAADHMDDGVGLPDVGQDLLPRPAPWLAPFTRPAMSTNSMTARGLLVRLVHLRQVVQPLVRHGHHAHVGVDGAEGVVGALGAGVGDGVETEWTCPRWAVPQYLISILSYTYPETLIFKAFCLSLFFVYALFTALFSIRLA